MNPFTAAIITAISAFSVIAFIVQLRRKQLIGSLLGRKLLHVCNGPCFALCWLLFDPSHPSSRYLAAAVPFLCTLYFIANGMGLVQNQTFISTVSRQGKCEELLVGPTLYGIIHVFATIFYWTDSPIGVISLMTLCVGDGLADVFGRRFGKLGLPWNSRKTWAGSIAFCVASLLASTGICLLFELGGVVWSAHSSSISSSQWFHLQPHFLQAHLILVSACTLVESLPIDQVDNVTVFLTGVVVGKLVYA